MRSGMGLAYWLVVAYAGQMAIVFDLCRVVDVVAENCMVKDKFDHFSS